MYPCQLPVTERFRPPCKSPSPCTSPETTKWPVPRILPTNTDSAPMKVGVAELPSKNRRFCSLMGAYYPIRDRPWCDELGVAATSRIEVEWRLTENHSRVRKMAMNKAVIGLCFTLLLGIYGCSRQQSDWEKSRTANTTDAYEQFIKKYPNGEFTAQAQARLKELYEERDWQKARDADTQEAYQAFLKQYPEGKWTEEARIRVENFTLAQAPSNGAPAGAEAANTAGNPAGTAATAGAAASPAAGAAAAAPAATQPSAAAPAMTASPAITAAPVKAAKS